MTRRRTKALKGKWRIVAMPAGEADHLDLVEPAYITLDGKGGGEIVFGALRAALECGVAWTAPTSTSAASMKWAKSQETAPVERQADGSLEGEFAYDNGDKSTLKAKPWQQPALNARRARLSDVI